jgi:hypothetical protein
MPAGTFFIQVQAELLDADGLGVPSAHRLLKATLLATPAVDVSTVRTHQPADY